MGTKHFSTMVPDGFLAMAVRFPSANQDYGRSIHFGEDMRLTFKTRIAAALLVTVAVATLGSGKGLADSKKRLNQDEVREAVTSGRIRPLEEVLAAAAKVVPGQVIKVEIERKRGVLIYEIKVIAGQGRVREVEIDAATLEVLEVE